jgi:lipid-binding SYLF domain-containing protein
MKTFSRPFGASLLLLAAAGNLSWAGGKELRTMESAAAVVGAFSAIPLQGIPPAMLRDATGVAVIPHVVKAGFLIGGRYGEGVVLPRKPDGGWGDPVFVSLTGGGFGLQAGIQSTDVVLVFKTRNSLNRVLRGGGKLTLGGDAAIAAGPVGRQAAAATDGELKAEIYSWSRSRGLFAGVSLEGAVLLADAVANAAFSFRGPEEAAAAERLKLQLERLSGPAVPVVVPVPAPPPPLVPVAPPPPVPVPLPPR